MERLWAPWRMQYIASASAGKTTDCIFCRFPAEQCDDVNHVVERGEHAFIVLNAYPYTNGHLMIAPYRHTADLNDLTDLELLETTRLVRRAVNLLKTTYKPEGFNIGVNMGRVAGAGIADHVHVHVVPRWNGDTNFMAVVGDVRVVPESLDNVYARLKELRDG
jgi:ATP adenylyltransferase